jgi:hypothetical protein
MGPGKLRRSAASGQGRARILGSERQHRSRRKGATAAVVLLLLLRPCGRIAAQTELPDAPVPAMALLEGEAAGGEGGGGAAQETFPPQGRRQRGFRMPGFSPEYVPVPQTCRTQACSQPGPQTSCCQRSDAHFSVYLRQNALRTYTREELAKMAARGVIDPFNLLTIAYTSAFSVATNSHSPFGPGMKGFAKLSGVAVTQDMTGEFFGTFLIPSISHEDPYFHRIPNARLQRRIAHCIYQVFWTQNDRGEGIPNYSTLAGVPAEEAVGSLYIPYREIGWKPSLERVATDWATAPIGNFVTEFVPEIARHINLRVVLVQRIINRVAIQTAGEPPE